MDEKSTLVFQAQLHIGGEKFSVMVRLCLCQMEFEEEETNLYETIIKKSDDSMIIF